MDEMTLGTSEKSGNCDYWLNCGSDQGCGYARFKDLIKNDGSPNKNYMEQQNTQALCSHKRASQVLLSAVKESCNFKVKECKDCDEGMKKFNQCNVGDMVEGKTLPPWSECSADDDVNYYVSSANEGAFCNEY